MARLWRSHALAALLLMQSALLGAAQDAVPKPRIHVYELPAHLTQPTFVRTTARGSGPWRRAAELH